MPAPADITQFDGLDEFASVRQLEYLDAVRATGSMRKAAAKLGVNKTAVEQGLARLARSASLRRYEKPGGEFGVLPDPLSMSGVSDFYGPDGKLRNKWVKSTVSDQQRAAIMRSAMDAMVSELPKIDVAPEPLDWQTDVIPWIQIGDAHLGMLAHASEVNEDFNLHIAETEMCAAISILVDELPNCERIVVNDLGDFTHYENFAGVTEASGHALDLDGRFPKMIDVYVRVMRFIVEKCLTKARHVDVICNQGNHSRTNDIWMAVFLRAVYEHTGRVHVLNNHNPFIAYRMGNTLVMTNHSDKCKPAKLGDVMMHDFRVDFGETEHHYIDIGHIHHNMILKEHPNVVIESFNHLAAYDKWAHDFGYRNRKSITIVLRSRQFGEVGRRLLPIQEVRARIERANGAGRTVTKAREVFTV